MATSTGSGSGEVRTSGRGSGAGALSAVGARGGRVAMGGASTLIQVVPDGTIVKRGDVLAVLDSSEYEELLRLQRIYAERSKADRLRAQLDLEVAQLAVRKFREGTMTEIIEAFRGRVLLARADLERARDRLNWSLGMKAKGYGSASTVKTDEHSLACAEEALKNLQGRGLLTVKEDRLYALAQKR